MLKTLRVCVSVATLGILAVIAPASAQFPPGPDDATDPAQPGGSKAKRAAAPQAAGPSINGSWSGQLKQVGSEAPYGLELTINANGAQTKYPDLDCTGKLTRVGSSKSYAFFVEVITKGQVDKGGRCRFREICGGSRSRAFPATGAVMASDPLCVYEPGRAVEPVVARVQ